MEDVVSVQCPYCSEWTQLYVDPGTAGRIVEDCEVCCRPWEVILERDDDGEVYAIVHRA